MEHILPASVDVSSLYIFLSLPRARVSPHSIREFMGFNTELSISSGNVANLLQITKEYIAKQNKYKKKKNILQL